MAKLLFEQDELNTILGEELVTQARKSMDLDSITGFRFDARGRIEGGVKPAPPSTEPSAFVKITKRGKRVMVDCRRHGKPDWCLHAAILALHHAGSKPIVRTRQPAPSESQPKIGFRFLAQFTPQHLRLRLARLSAGFVHKPLIFLEESASVVGLPQATLEHLQDVAESERESLLVPRGEIATFLTLLGSLPLYADVASDPITIKRSPQAAPQVFLRIKQDRLHYRLSQAPNDKVFLPGRPGFVYEAGTLWRFDDYVADLNDFPQQQGDLPLDAATLAKMMGQKHGVVWESDKPKRVFGLEDAGLEMAPSVRDLQGRFGVWWRDRFLQLESWDDTLQLLKDEHGQRYLLQTSSFELAKWRRALDKLRAPWQGTEFLVREQSAHDFLQNMNTPNELRVSRQQADRWFGLEPLEVDVDWDGVGEPRYSIGGQTFTHQSLLAGLTDGTRGLRMADGQWLNVDTGVIRANQQVLQSAGELHEDPDKQQAFLRRLVEGDTQTAEAVELPQRWTETLRSYQQEGVRWLIGNYRNDEPALLADDMGLGKTVQTLAFLELVKTDQPQLVVVPKTLLMNWRDECRKFTAKRKITIHHGAKRTKDASVLSEADLVLTTYGTVRQDLDMLYDVEFDVVVLDEAQAIKNAKSQTAQAICELWCNHRVALSGTPIENNLSELWSIFNFLAPGYLGPEEHVKQIGLPGSAAFGVLKMQLQPFLKRRLKREVATELPEKQEMVVRLPLPAAQARMYERVRRDIRSELEQQAGGGNVMGVLTKLLRLRQICCHPGLVDDTQLRFAAPKVEYLLESLDEVMAAGHAALVFSQFTQLLKLVRYELEEREIPYLYLDGATSDRHALVQRFQAGDGPPVFLISLKAGGTGLNLTRASYVYHLDPWWNPMVEAQATDRAHRIGQKNTVTTYKLIMEDSIEERILEMQSSKKFLAEGLWEDEASLAAKFDRDTLAALLQ